MKCFLEESECPLRGVHCIRHSQNKKFHQFFIQTQDKLSSLPHVCLTNSLLITFLAFTGAQESSRSHNFTRHSSRLHSRLHSRLQTFLLAYIVSTLYFIMFLLCYLCSLQVSRSRGSGSVTGGEAPRPAPAPVTLRGISSHEN